MAELSEEDEPDYPSGVRLIMIGFGLCLAVLCSNLVFTYPFPHMLVRSQNATVLNSLTP